MMNEILIMQLEKERDSLISHISRSSRMDVMRLYNVKSYDVVIDMLSKYIRGCNYETANKLRLLWLSKYIRRMPNEIK
jgi:hypothetical protein